MSFHEKSTWIILIALIGTVGLYGAWIYSAGAAVTFPGIFAAVMGFSLFVAVTHVGMGIAFHREAGKLDERDRRIDARAARVGDFILTLAVLIILGMSLIKGDWVIANIAFFGLFGAAVVKSTLMLIFYRLNG